MLLDELRIDGIHGRIDTYLDSYLAAATLNELYKRIFARYERDYDPKRPNLVRDALSLLGAAPDGISETEFLELLGRDGLPLPSMFWSPVRLALGESVVQRVGKLCLANDQLRDAIRDKYLSGSNGKGTHGRLARKLHQRLFEPDGHDNFRLNEEYAQDVSALKHLPYHACEAEKSRIWKATMTDFAYLDAVVSHVDVTVGWAPDGSEIAWHEGYFLILDELSVNAG